MIGGNAGTSGFKGEGGSYGTIVLKDSIHSLSKSSESAGLTCSESLNGLKDKIQQIAGAAGQDGAIGEKGGQGGKGDI